MTQTILIVDDEPNTLAALAYFLKRAGYKTLCAANGMEALAIILEESIDIMLLDLQMPTMTGTELVAELDRDKFSFPIIMMTGYISDDVEKQLLDLGLTTIAKPSTREEVLERVALALKQQDIPESQP